MYLPISFKLYRRGQGQSVLWVEDSPHTRKTNICIATTYVPNCIAFVLTRRDGHRAACSKSKTHYSQRRMPSLTLRVIACLLSFNHRTQHGSERQCFNCNGCWKYGGNAQLQKGRRAESQDNEDALDIFSVEKSTYSAFYCLKVESHAYLWNQLVCTWYKFTPARKSLVYVLIFFSTALFAFTPVKSHWYILYVPGKNTNGSST